jgi:hypothetical protein
MIAHPAVLTWSGVTARRMARHALAEPSAELDPAGAAGLLCGAHAQILTAAEFSVGRRIAGATRADVRRALWEDRVLVKTFGPRGTVHLLPAVDLPMWTGALSALPPSAPVHPEGVRFTDGQAAEVIAAIGDALAGPPPTAQAVAGGDSGTVMQTEVAGREPLAVGWWRTRGGGGRVVADPGCRRSGSGGPDAGGDVAD